MEVYKIKVNIPHSEQKFDKYRIEDRFYFVYPTKHNFVITDGMGRQLTEVNKSPSKQELIKIHKCLAEYQSHFEAQDHKDVLDDAFGNFQEIDSSLKEMSFKLNYSGINNFELFDEFYNVQRSFSKLLDAFRKLNKQFTKEIKKS